ncbi:MAG: hypothetical protein ABGW77_02245 [Campylobacterales bacterium]
MDGFGSFFYFNQQKIEQMGRIGKKLPPFPKLKLEESIQLISPQFQMERKVSYPALKGGASCFTGR